MLATLTKSFTPYSVALTIFFLFFSQLYTDTASAYWSGEGVYDPLEFDAPLSDRGVQQAAELGALVKGGSGGEAGAAESTEVPSAAILVSFAYDVYINIAVASTHAVAPDIQKYYISQRKCVFEKKRNVKQ